MVQIIHQKMLIKKNGDDDNFTSILNILIIVAGSIGVIICLCALYFNTIGNKKDALKKA